MKSFVKFYVIYEFRGKWLFYFMKHNILWVNSGFNENRVFNLCIYWYFPSFLEICFWFFGFFFFFFSVTIIRNIFVLRVRFKENLKSNIILFAWIFWRVQQCIYIKTNKWASKNNEERIYSWTMVTRQKRTVTMFPNAKFMFLVFPLTFSKF